MQSLSRCVPPKPCDTSQILIWVGLMKDRWSYLTYYTGEIIFKGKWFEIQRLFYRRNTQEKEVDIGIYVYYGDFIREKKY